MVGHISAGMGLRTASLITTMLLVTGCSSASVQALSSTQPLPTPTPSAIGLSAPEAVGGPFEPRSTVQLQVVAGEPVMVPSHSWELAAAAPNSRTVTISWIDSGGAQCGGLVASARVQENPDTVVIQLVDGPRPTSPDGLYRCADNGVQHGADIPLSQPLGARRLLQPCLPAGTRSDNGPDFVCR
jgi:hypothetical protein